MIDVAIPREPWWLDLPGGVRVHVRPLTTALMLAARQRLRQDRDDEADGAQRIEGLVKALAAETVPAWVCAAADGVPMEPSPATTAPCATPGRSPRLFGAAPSPSPLRRAERSGRWTWKLVPPE